MCPPPHLFPISQSPHPPLLNLNHPLVFLDELPRVLILLFGIMSLHAGLDMASPGRELLLHIRGSSGLLICAAERDLTGRFKCKKSLLNFISLLESKLCTLFRSVRCVFLSHLLLYVLLSCKLWLIVGAEPVAP